MVGRYGEEEDVSWLMECFSKTSVQLDKSDVTGGEVDARRWRSLDFSLAKGHHGLFRNSCEPLAEDVLLAAG